VKETHDSYPEWVTPRVHRSGVVEAMCVALRRTQEQMRTETQLILKCFCWHFVFTDGFESRSACSAFKAEDLDLCRSRSSPFVVLLTHDVVGSSAGRVVVYSYVSTTLLASASSCAKIPDKCLHPTRTVPNLRMLPDTTFSILILRQNKRQNL